MSRSPANALNADFCIAVKEVLDNINEKSCKGIILSSNLPNIFSAGLDLKMIRDGDKEYISKSWRALQDLWMTLYKTNIPTVAAINVSYQLF